MWVEGVVRVEGSRDSSAGRYVVAAKDLPAGSLVLTEEPLVWGPKQSSPLVCVNCCEVMQELRACNRCGLPQCLSCSQIKEDDSIHLEECSLLTDNQRKFNFKSIDEATKVYSMVTILRLLLLKDWDEFETHSSERTDSPIWLFNNKFVVPLISNLKNKDGQAFSVEKIHEASGALDTNTFEVKLVNQSGSVTMISRALYPKAAMFNNSCSPSCNRTFSGTTISFHTSRDVRAGEELTICYTGLLQPTSVRQAVFKQTKHFVCACQRCRDPTELGTFFSSLACQECGENMLGSPSTCSTCGEKIEEERKQQVLEMTGNLVNRLETQDCIVWKSSFVKLRRFLSKHHYILSQLKEKYLKHANSCGECKESEEVTRCKNELEWLRTKLGEWPAEGKDSKILKGGDIVKQAMRRKLAESIRGGSIKKETIDMLTK